MVSGIGRQEAASHGIADQRNEVIEGVHSGKEALRRELVVCIQRKEPRGVPAHPIRRSRELGSIATHQYQPGTVRPGLARHLESDARASADHHHKVMVHEPHIRLRGLRGGVGAAGLPGTGLGWLKLARAVRPTILRPRVA
jgi:hypothetical protein